VFEPLVLEECCAQVIRGGEVRARAASNAAVYRSRRTPCAAPPSGPR
jgi:hypothetical protein